MKTNSRIKALESSSKKDLRKLITEIDGLSDLEIDELLSKYKVCNKPLILGLLGSPGAGKSTFLNKFLDYKKNNFSMERWAVLLIDPSNPFNSGAILGDRVRLSSHYLDESIFIRSLSNNGQESGVPNSLGAILMSLSIFGFDKIIVESVGGGQSTIGVTSYCDSSIVIYDPGAGDGIQHLKSGVLDIADFIVVSKSDLFNAQVIKDSLQQSISKPGIDIFTFGINDSSDQIFGKLTDKKSRDSYGRCIQKYLIKKVEESVFEKLKIFSDSYFTKTRIDDYSRQEFFNQFKIFFNS